MFLKQHNVCLQVVHSVTKNQLDQMRTSFVNGMRKTLRRVKHTLSIYGEFNQHESCCLHGYKKSLNLWKTVRLTVCKKLGFNRYWGLIMHVSHHKSNFHRDTEKKSFLMRQNCGKQVQVNVLLEKLGIPTRKTDIWVQTQVGNLTCNSSKISVILQCMGKFIVD